MLEHVERRLFDKPGSPVASTVTLLGGDFSMAGELMVMSILQGGPAPNFLDSSVFQYLVNQPLCPMQLHAYTLQRICTQGMITRDCVRKMYCNNVYNTIAISFSYLYI